VFNDILQHKHSRTLILTRTRQPSVS